MPKELFSLHPKTVYFLAFLTAFGFLRPCPIEGKPSELSE